MRGFWEKAEQLVTGEVLLIRSEDIHSLQSLVSIIQLVSELKVRGSLDGNLGLPPNCLKLTTDACNLIFQDIQRRLDALIEDGGTHFRELAKAVEG